MFGPEITDALLALRPGHGPEPAAALLGPEEALRLAPARAVLAELLAAVEATTADGLARRVDLSGLDAENAELIDQALREGEVLIRLGEDVIRIQEAAFPGIWRVATPRGDWLEVADMPSLVREWAGNLPEGIVIPADPLPAGTMNVMPVLAEIRERLIEAGPGQPNHEITLTLLPMTPADLEVLAGTLGVGPIDILSRGYGNCRILAGACRNLWHLQFFNSEDKVILDSIQIGDVPIVALAADEDIAESARRLREVAEAYF